LSGRLVDDESRPLRHTQITVYYHYEGDPHFLHNHFPGNVETDAEGRFHVRGMVPGVRYVGHVHVKGQMFPGIAFDRSGKAGESIELGDRNPRARGK
jgi:hypothetical protein